jgi:hypothetical protein
MKGRSRPWQGGSEKTTEALDVDTSLVPADYRSGCLRAVLEAFIDAFADRLVVVGTMTGAKVCELFMLRLIGGSHDQ